MRRKTEIQRCAATVSVWGTEINYNCCMYSGEMMMVKLSRSGCFKGTRNDLFSFQTVFYSYLCILSQRFNRNVFRFELELIFRNGYFISSLCSVRILISFIRYKRKENRESEVKTGIYEQGPKI